MRHMSHIKIICLGSSAGGLAPTIEFFKHFAPNSNFAFVVIQHLKADTPSLTPSILANITRIAVSVANDEELIQANHIYTMRPNTQLNIVGERFHVRPRTESPARHKPFDRFLNSLAVDVRERAIAVILSGYDGDGSDGFITIKSHGGTTYAQDHSAEADEMPEHAIATGCVDFVLSPRQIAEHISPPG
jgi:two-component system, chemotaxis family, CheB/CheR fusion protein